MTTHSLLVVLEEDLPENNAAHLAEVIGLLRGVIEVQPQGSDMNSQMAMARARHELRKQLADIVRS